MMEPLRAIRPRTTELLRGDLKDVSLVSLLQLAQAEAISGWLRVEGRGEICLLKGHVGSATCGRLTGVEALRELAFHDRGRFVLARGEPAGERCDVNVPFALMDAYRLRDEWKRLADVVLRRVDEALPTGLSQAELAAHLDQSESSISTLVDRMRRDGLLYRLRSKTDRRMRSLMLTDTGRTLLTQARAGYDRTLAELLSPLDPVHVSMLNMLLRLLTTELDKIEIAPPAAVLIASGRGDADLQEAVDPPAAFRAAAGAH